MRHRLAINPTQLLPTFGPPSMEPDRAEAIRTYHSQIFQERLRSLHYTPPKEFHNMIAYGAPQWDLYSRYRLKNTINHPKHYWYDGFLRDPRWRTDDYRYWLQYNTFPDRGPDTNPHKKGDFWDLMMIPNPRELELYLKEGNTLNEIRRRYWANEDYAAKQIREEGSQARWFRPKLRNQKLYNLRKQLQRAVMPKGVKDPDYISQLDPLNSAEDARHFYDPYELQQD
eukprot:UN02667